METTTNLQVMNTPVSEKRRRSPIAAAKSAYTAFACAIIGAMCCNPVYATATTTTTTIWTKANEIMKDVYSQVLLISTIAAVVTASVALLLMNFSRSGRTVDESRAWLKRIIITWCILNGLGFIMAYVTPFFSDGKWVGYGDYLHHTPSFNLGYPA